MGLDKDLEALEDFEQELQYLDIGKLLKFYTNSSFRNKLMKIAAILQRRGIHPDLVAELVRTGLKQRTYYERIKPNELTLGYFQRSAGFLFPTTGGDPLLELLRPMVDKVASDRDSLDTKKVLQAIDAEFETPVDELIGLIPSELEEAKNYLVKATKSFAEGRSDESALFTRKAWESCVNYALGKLPREKGHESLSSKTKYVLDQIGQTEQSRFINDLKNLYEGRFLHVLEETEKMVEQDLPFYIALTTGFVNLVARRLTK